MADFPKLKSGAVLQYPATKRIDYLTHVTRFLDGSEQRFREFSTPLYRWIIRLDYLLAEERSALEAFFLLHKGSAENFSFIDPWTDIEHPDCSFEGDTFNFELLAEAHCRLNLIIRSNQV